MQSVDTLLSECQIGPDCYIVTLSDGEPRRLESGNVSMKQLDCTFPPADLNMHGDIEMQGLLDKDKYLGSWRGIGWSTPPLAGGKFQGLACFMLDR
jgi:hypothetical protein